MSPAKATRPGFCQSIASTDPQRNGQSAINLFHPIYHCFTYPIGCRTDIERILPANLEDEDTEELIDNFSEPPVWVERFSPLAVQVGDQIIRGKNASDLMLKVYRTMFDLFQGVGRFIESTMSQSTGDDGITFPFMSVCIDPDTMHRIIEADYESGDTTYSTIIKLFSQGTVSPCLTTPFHSLLPLLNSDAEIRLCVRSSLIFYLRIVKIFSDFLGRHGENGLLVVPFWLPESAYSQRLLDILDEEFQTMLKKEKLGAGHLLLMLDNHQAENQENDVLMKSWNQVPVSHAGNGRSKSAARDKHDGLHPGVQNASLLFRDRAFSDWVIHANPSVKKLLDRTIAKVDSDINSQNVHYGWAHFEEMEAITYTPRAMINFQQKLIKLTELGYLPLAPDFYIRGKLRGEFGCTHHEPQNVSVKDGSAGNGWDLTDSKCLGRWLGRREGCEGPDAFIAKPYQRLLPNGEKVTEEGSPCWKIAWHKAHQKCYQAVVGDLETLKGGMVEVLATLCGHDNAERRRQNVHDFLANYTYVYWREHFIQHDLAEADINIEELSNKYLRAGIKRELEPLEIGIAGAAAQAIYFALDSTRSVGTGYENMDQRAFYQNVVMITLALVNSIYVSHWQGNPKNGRKLLGLLNTELVDFENAFERYQLAKLGFNKSEWIGAIKSEIEESRDNVVKRAAMRVAARHLRPLGYTKEFSRQDANATTNVGHIWSIETGRDNFCYENRFFCGVSEE